MTRKQALSLTIGMLALGVILLTDAAGLPEVTTPLMICIMVISLVASYVWT